MLPKFGSEFQVGWKCFVVVVEILFSLLFGKMFAYLKIHNNQECKRMKKIKWASIASLFDSAMSECVRMCMLCLDFFLYAFANTATTHKRKLKKKKLKQTRNKKKSATLLKGRRWKMLEKTKHHQTIGKSDEKTTTTTTASTATATKNEWEWEEKTRKNAVFFSLLAFYYFFHIIHFLI